MNELRIFSNEEFGEVRMVTIDNEPWFVGKDVAEILAYINPNEAVQDHIDPEDKLNSKTLSSFGLDLGQRGGWLINESGLYSLILSSKMPRAKKFKHWVTSEILPTIRKHGMYATEETIDKILGNPDFGIQLLTALKEERKRTTALQQENETMKPKAEYFDGLVDKKLNTGIRDTAKELGIKERMFVSFLLENGYVYRQGPKGELRPYAQYSESGKGLFVLKDRQNNNGWTGQQMFITPKGKETFRLLLEDKFPMEDQ